MPITTLHTARLILRPWKWEDLPLFAALNADHEVMAYFPAPLSTKESDALAQRIMDAMEHQGFGLWAMERRADGMFLGFTGLQSCNAALPFAPALEVGWRMARKYWGQGYASEAAQACLHFAFTVLQEKELVSFTATSNVRSQAVMRRLGMAYRRTFEHPALPLGHPLREHVLYTTTAADYAHFVHTKGDHSKDDD